LTGFAGQTIPLSRQCAPGGAQRLRIKKGTAPFLHRKPESRREIPRGGLLFSLYVDLGALD